MFRLSVPFTREDGASVPLRILDLDRALMFVTKGLLVTGSADSLINIEVATRIGLNCDIPCRIAITDGTTTIEISETFRAVELQRDVILGMSFMGHFKLVFDGPNKTVTLTQ